VAVAGCLAIAAFAGTAPVDFGEQFIRAVNSADPELQKTLLRSAFSPATLDEVGIDRLLGLVQRLHGEYAPLTYHHSDTLTFEKPGGPSRVMHIYARKAGNAMWSDFQFRLDPAAPHQLATIAFIAEVSEPISLPNGSIDRSDTLRWLGEYIDKLEKETDLSGSLLIAKGEQIVFERYFGFADAARKRRVDRDTLFNLGSGNKMFTALAIARLVEAGSLRYDDPVTRYVSGFSDPAKAAAISIHHLLSHTSGLGEYWSGQQDESIARCTKISEHLPFVFRAGFRAAAGSGYSYCNSNFIVLGAVIEKASGEDYFEFIRETVYRPAGMAASDSYLFGAAGPALAEPLTRKPGGGWVLAPHKARGSAAGGGYSHARDMLRFSRALASGRIVRQDTLAGMTAAKNGAFADAGEQYGYGFILERHGQVASYGHGGTSRGVDLEFRYFPALDLTLVAFSNQDNGAFDDLKRNTIKLITGAR
jgi:CubicO group peptidase (beta-lactamase class C family)